MLLSKSVSFKARLSLVVIVLAATAIMILLGLDKIVSSELSKWGIFGAIIAGAFYTFGISTPFAMAVILELMNFNDQFSVIIISCATAAVVDCVFFSIMRDSLEKNTKYILMHIRKKYKSIVSFAPFMGFFIFGLPLPDEFALALMGITKIELKKLWVIIFLAKTITLLILWKAIF